MSIFIQENVSLAPLSRMRTGGVAKFLTHVSSLDEIREALSFAEKKNLPYWIFGGGSNTLIPDEGFSGLVMVISVEGISYEPMGDRVLVTLGAGEVWDDVVRNCVSRELWGIENLSLIPGSVGGGVVQNIGAYGVEICEIVVWVEAFDIRANTIKRFSREASLFEYRTSLFKKDPRYIITRVALELHTTPHPRLAYEDVSRHLREKELDTPSLADMRAAIIEIRMAKLPGEDLGTLGSFFKNPVVSSEEGTRLERIFPGIKTYPYGEGFIKLSAAWLIDHAGGFRGMRQGDAGVYEKQSLVLVNHAHATTRDIQHLAESIKKKIFDLTTIMLEEEVVVMK